jgi:hypothetical protein
VSYAERLQRYGYSRAMWLPDLLYQTGIFVTHFAVDEPGHTECLVWPVMSDWVAM